MQPVEAKDQLERFASITVHHFREPLRMIATFSQLLAEAWAGKAEGESTGYLSQMRAAADRMQSMLDRLTEFSSVSSGSRMDSVRLDLALRNAIATLNSEIQQSGAVVDFDALPRVTGDFDQLTLLFKHLAQNAIRYRGEQPPVIRIAAKRGDKEWIITVEDNGTGIDWEYAARVFGPYERLHDRSYPGVGLGLTICKAIAEAHNGRIWLDATSGRGSTFAVALPAD
jgi:light-regulated signal transduction histidine kinase (bacteriophytochrome)